MSSSAAEPSPSSGGDTPSAGPPAADVRTLQRALVARLKHTVGKNPETATTHAWFVAAATVARDLLVDTWMDTMRARHRAHAKRVYYLSLEFLVGRSLTNTLLALDALDGTRAALAELGVAYDAVAEAEPEAALGNGGLGRLAACFVDSMAALGIPGDGYGIHYRNGMFRQAIDDTGAQLEQPENWLTAASPWTFHRPEIGHRIGFGGTVDMRDLPGLGLMVRWQPARTVIAEAYDLPVPGHGGFSASSIRLWAARADQPFDLADFNRGDYHEAVRAEVDSETLSRVLYPDDSTSEGRALRLEQEYFFAAASVADILRRFRRDVLDAGGTWADLPDKVAVQLNDTHPVLAVAELMRVLVDLEKVDWDAAWAACTGVFAYTNHTLLPEALETWPVDLLEATLPRHLQIVYEINRRFLENVTARFPGEDDLLARVSLIDETGGRRVRMAHLAFVASHRVNGVARLHTELMRAGIFADLDRVLPGRIVNQTNGITPRRWLLSANPPLAGLATRTVGEGWPTDLERLRALVPAADDPDFRAAFRDAKRHNKARLAALIAKRGGRAVDPDSLFDVQVKRIHEYKRQLLNVLQVIWRWQAIVDGRLTDPQPRTVIFAGKAAPAYTLAKLIVRLIVRVGDALAADPRVRDVLAVAFVPNYDVSTAEVIIPAAELSQQISTAGTEASGTGNMKLALNGAITLGTRDGANIEIAEEVGEENLLFFGLDAAEATALRAAGNYNPFKLYTGDDELRAVLDTLRDGTFAPPGARDAFKPLFDQLTAYGDRYLLLADFRSYLAAQARIDAWYRDPDAWWRSAVLNTARMGKFASDQTVLGYAADIWGVHPKSPVPRPLGGGA